MRALGLPILPLRWLIAMAFGGLAALLIAGIGLLVEYEGSRRLQFSSEMHLRHVAEYFATRLDRRLHHHWQFLRIFRDGLPSGTAETTDRMRLEKLRNIRRLHPDFSLIAIASTDATILLGDPTTAVGRRVLGPRITPDGGSIEFLPAVDADSHLPVPTFRLPIRGQRSEDHALVAQLDWAALVDLHRLDRLDHGPIDGMRILLVTSQTILELTHAGLVEIPAAPERYATLARLDASPAALDWDGHTYSGVRISLTAEDGDMHVPLAVVALEDREAALRPVTDLRRSVIQGGLVFVALAILLAWLLAFWIAAPLNRIARVANQDVSPIDLSTGPVGYREIGDVAAALTRLVIRARDEGARRASAFATSLDGVLVLDEDGRVEAINPAAQRMFGRDAPGPGGMHVRLLLPEPRSDEHDGYMRRLLGDEEQRMPGIGRVLFGRRADGSTFPCLVTMGESRLSGGRRIYTAFLRDMSQARENERQLRNAQAELDSMHRLISVGQVGSQLSHEITQPLGAIANYAQAARKLIASDGAAGLRRADELLGKLITQVERASGILRQLRRFVATPAAARKPRDINALIRRSIALAIGGPSFDHIRISTDLAPELPRVRVDQVEIQQVLTNLIINAGEAMAESDQALLEIRSRRLDDRIAIDVADRGPGLPPTVAQRLFQPFVTTKPDGLGLGLSICRSIIEAHGGRISATSNPGGGTVFTIMLPLESSDG